jgi:hypothetical protein
MRGQRDITLGIVRLKISLITGVQLFRCAGIQLIFAKTVQQINKMLVLLTINMF